MSVTLPADLKTAEADALQALVHALKHEEGRRWTVTWRFEGLRLLPVVIRFVQGLRDAGLDPLWPGLMPALQRWPRGMLLSWLMRAAP